MLHPPNAPQQDDVNHIHGNNSYYPC
jgi:hypothetical protein